MTPHFPWKRGRLTLETEADVETCVKLHTDKPAPNMEEQFVDFKNSEEKEQWLEAFREAVRMYYMESDQAVLQRCKELGMDGDGELVHTMDYQRQRDVECSMTGWKTQPIEEEVKPE